MTIDGIIVCSVVGAFIIFGGIYTIYKFATLNASIKREQKQFEEIRAKIRPKPSAADIFNMKIQLEKLCANSIKISISGVTDYIKGGTRFGGQPDVPKDFKWPYFETATADDKAVKPRPLAFLAQFNLSEISAFDTESLLPRSGTLAFFYELSSMRGGYERCDKGCAKVFWFGQFEDLLCAEFPEDLPASNRFPALSILSESDKSYPCSEDFYLGRTDFSRTIVAFREAEKLLGASACHKSSLLGYADVIQGNITSDCELIARGYNSDEVWNGDDFPAEELAKIEEGAKEWTLLFQLGAVGSDDCKLEFGNCGKIYFYIRKEDLRLKRFDRIWLIQQSL